MTAGAVRMGDARAACSLLVACTSFVAALLQCGHATGAERTDLYDWEPTLALEPAEPIAATEPASPERSSRYQVTAREWISAISKLEAHNNSVSTTQMYLFGGSISYVPAWDSGVAFLLSGYYGASMGYSNFFDYNSEGSSTLRRLDVEALVQIPLIATAYASLGVRYIDFKRDDNGTAHGYYVDNNGQLQPFTVPYKRLTGYKYYLGELGIGSVTTLDEDKRHRTFGGVMFVAGGYRTGQDYSYFNNLPIYGLDLAADRKFTPTIGMDTHFGYAYYPWSSVSLSLRYRAFVMADIYDYLPRITNRGVSWPIDYSHYSLVHGPEFNLAIQF
jgi:hypothetical protein